MSVCEAERCHLLSGTGNKKSLQTAVVCLHLFVYLCLLVTHTHLALIETLGPLCCQHSEESSLCSPLPSLVDAELAAASS